MKKKNIYIFDVRILSTVYELVWLPDRVNSLTQHFSINIPAVPSGDFI